MSMYCRQNLTAAARFARGVTLRLLQEPPNEWPSVFELYGLAYANTRGCARCFRLSIIIIIKKTKKKVKYRSKRNKYIDISFESFKDRGNPLGVTVKAKEDDTSVR